MLSQSHSEHFRLVLYSPFVVIRRITVAIRKKPHSVNEP